MKANELRIGNWVELGKEPCRITAIPPSIAQEFRYEVVYEDGTVVETMSAYEEDSIQPIPLTEEWLEKFGFGDFGYGRYEIGHFKLLYAHDEEWMLDTGGIEPYIKYVHQLQNLYFALTGVELELKHEA